MHVIILAGGFGTRLRHVVSDVPKPLAPIGGRPFLAWLIDALAREGATAVTLSVHHEWEKIRDYFAANPAAIPLDYAVEKTPLGTGGAMAFALAHYNSSPIRGEVGRGAKFGADANVSIRPHPNPPPTGEGILVVNGDTFVKLDYRALYAQHLQGNAQLTMALREVSDTSRYGRVSIDNGIITSFGIGLPGEAGLINAGIYVVRPDIFAGRALPEAFSFERDFVPPYLQELAPRTFIAEDYFIDIGIPEDYARACRELPDIA